MLVFAQISVSYALFTALLYFACEVFHSIFFYSSSMSVFGGIGGMKDWSAFTALCHSHDTMVRTAFLSALL